jgi:putative ABC transport system ATP-binding protein
MNMRLQLSNLSYSYNSGKGLKFPDVSLLPDENLLILGPSGSGKSTLLYLMAGLLIPHAGEVVVDNTHLEQLNTHKRDQFRARHIGMIWQKSIFVQALSLRENLRLVQKLTHQKVDDQRIQELCAPLNIDQHLNKKASELSVGEQQRFSIVRAMLNNPSLMLADEPTSALDDAHAEAVATLLIQSAAANQAPLVVVTHDTRLKHLFKKSIVL